MSRIVRAAGGLFFLALALVLVAVLLLPTLLSSEAVTRQLQGLARDATGSDLEWEALDVAFFPPALALSEPRARNPAMGEEPWFSAERVELRLAWMPLLVRTLLVTSLTFEGPDLSLRRDAEGWQLPGEVAREAEATPEAPPPDRSSEPEASGFSVALRKLSIRNGKLHLIDESASTTHRVDLEALRADLVARSPRAPVALSMSALLGGGRGSLDLEGEVSPERDLDLELRFRDLAMEIAQPYLEDELVLAGRAHGVAVLRGAAARLDRVELTLASDDAAIASEDLSASGPLELELSLDDFERPAGEFSFDATRAVLVYQVLFRKPAGVEAQAGGTFRTRPDGSLDIDFNRVQIKDVDARGELRGGASPTLNLSAKPFSLDGWGELVPALQGVGGRAGIPELSLILPTASAPLRASGRATLEGVHVALSETPDADGEELVLDGELLAEGEGLTSRGLVARYAGQSFPVDLRIVEPFGEARLSLQSALEGVDANAFTSALAAAPDTLFGTLSLEATLETPISGQGPLSDTLGGEIGLRVEPGRLRGVSLLRSAIDSMGPLAEAALLAGQLHGGRTLQRVFEDEFTELSGTFALARGRARTEDLRLVYRDYQLDLRGSVGLEDGGLDLSGTLTLFDEEESEAGSEASPRRARQVLPLARVRGSIDRPRVKIDPDVALAWATGLRRGGDSAGESGEPAAKTRLEEEIDERLGTGSGREIFDALEGLLGSGSRGRP